MLSSFTSLALSLILGARAASASAQSPIAETTQRNYEQLDGFVGVVVKQINKGFGTDRLPAANGFPVEPGMYVTMATNELAIFDRVGATLAGGVPQDKTVAAECQSGCSRTFYDALRRSWLDLKNEGEAIGDEIPNRVLIAADSSLPARSFVDLAYASAESRPGPVPNMYILLNAGPGGLRARNFFLVPPGGLKLSASTNALGLRIKVNGGARYEVSSADGRSVKKQTISGAEALSAYLSRLDRQYPSKNAVTLEVGDGAAVRDLVQAMVITEERFPIPILSMGDKLAY